MIEILKIIFVELSSVYLVSVVNISVGIWDVFVEFREFSQWLPDIEGDTQQNNLTDARLNRKTISKNPVTVETAGHISVGQTRLSNRISNIFFTLLHRALYAWNNSKEFFFICN